MASYRCASSGQKRDHRELEARDRCLDLLSLGYDKTRSHVCHTPSHPGLDTAKLEPSVLQHIPGSPTAVWLEIQQLG